MIKALLVVTFLLIAGCATELQNRTRVDSSTLPDRDTFYHYSIWWAFVNRVFDGELTVGELKKRGDVALGSYTQLDGELIMLDGVPYRVTEDGAVSEAKDDDKIAYVNATFLQPEITFSLNHVASYEEIRKLISAKLPTMNQFYAFRISGKFLKVTSGGLHKQGKPYERGLDVLIPNRPVFERNNFEGTIVGFYCPEFIGDINVAGYHLHIISDDGEYGGHVMEFSADSLIVEVDPLLQYHFALPGTQDFFDVELEKKFQYGNK